MNGTAFLGDGELAPEAVEGLGFAGYGGDGLAVVDFVADVVVAFGTEDAGGEEGVDAAVVHAEGHKVVVARYFVLCGEGHGAVAGLVDEDHGGGGVGFAAVAEGEIGGWQREGVVEVALGGVVAERNGEDLVFVAGVGGETVAYPFLRDMTFEEFPFDVEEVAIGVVGARGLPSAGIGAEGDVGEVEEVLVAGFEVVDKQVGAGVDEGDACAEWP